ncbi:MAG TPA: BACON domain-containing carbohydrate-binding protein [Vicinamibacterales bacterium]|nr:BACON domain-containing carbohydrate-binding protein [Vicinamibacterales bacterium]
MTPRLLAHRVIAVALAGGLALVSTACESTSETSTGPSPLKCQVSLEAPTDAIAPDGGRGAVTVSAQPECAWTATPGAAWITGLTPSSGQGNGRVEFQTSDNPAGTARQSYIAVNDQQAAIQQRPAACRFDVSPLAPSIDDDGGTVTITVTTLAGCQWQATGGSGWVAIANTSGTGPGSVSLRVARGDGAMRSAALVVAGHTVTVTQSATSTPPPGGGGTGGGAGAPCSYFIAPGSVSMSSAGGPGVAVAVSTAVGCSWTARSNDGWITLVSGSSGTGAGSVTFTVAANSGAARNGTLTIAGQTFSVGQASNCSYSISPTEEGIKEKGGSMSVAVSAGVGCQWAATSNESWIVITQGASGSGNGTVEFDVQAGKKRTGTLTIAGQTFTVHQNKKGENE